MKLFLGLCLSLYVLFCLALVLFLSHTPSEYTYSINSDVKDYPSPPKFSEFTIATQKKQQFFDYLSPIVEDENQRILKQRNLLLSLKQTLLLDKPLDTKATKKIHAFAKYYQVDKTQPLDTQIDELLSKVNIVPMALVLAQAANESAWGTSRFAVSGNNYFGQWCFTEGCGLVPKNRPQGAKHEVRVFASAAMSVRAYLLNINTHPAYKKLRSIRTKDKNNASGETLAEGLTSYSERGKEYVDEIKHMIQTNKLE